VNPSSFREALVRWLLRIASGYLLWFGIALYLNFMSEVSGGLIHNADIVKAIGLGLIFSTPLFIATFPSRTLYHRFITSTLIVMAVFFFLFTLAKPVMPYYVGTVSYTLGTLYLLKIKSAGQKNYTAS
jgi:hypothetical protein